MDDMHKTTRMLLYQLREPVNDIKKRDQRHHFYNRTFARPFPIFSMTMILPFYVENVTLL